jgi:hypothetical protein
MKRASSIGRTALACAIAAGLGLQAQEPKPSSAGTGVNELTVTGCLRSIESSSARESSISSSSNGATSSTTAKASEQSQTFVLTNAIVAPRPGAGTGALTDTYIVRGKSPELVRNVGHQVQISGHLVEPRRSTAGSKRRPSGDRPASLAGAKEIELGTLRMLGAVCPAADIGK